MFTKNGLPKGVARCDGCGNKNPHPYARLDGKAYCSRQCYQTAVQKKKNDPVMTTKYSNEVIGKPVKDYDEYPDNSTDEFGNDSGC